MNEYVGAVCAVCSMDEAVESYVGRRNDLTYRRLRGEALSPDEESELDAMNASLQLMKPES
jgi:hypothetical protein